jgi:hypothetical protein
MMPQLSKSRKILLELGDSLILIRPGLWYHLAGVQEALLG